MRRSFRGLLLSLGSVLLTLAATPGAYAAPPDLPPGLARAVEVQERNSDHLFSFSGVVGTGVGLPSENVPSIKVFLEDLTQPGLPQSLDGLPVEMVVTGPIYALRHACSGPPSGRPAWCSKESDPVDATVRFDRPVPIGVSTGHPLVTAGTICCRLINALGVFVMSNNHIYANSNRAFLDDPVLQPARFDGGSAPDDQIGTLYEFEPIAFDGSDNLIDAAVALTTSDDVDNTTPSDGYGPPSSITARPLPRMRVMKYGRTTGLTKGRIEAINAIIQVGYPLGIARFVQQIVVTGDGFAAGGDSGSLIVVDRGKSARKPVGLLFAGSGTHFVANPIDLVLDHFELMIDGD